MVGVAQLVEHWVVASVVAGSNPVTHPILPNILGILINLVCNISQCMLANIKVIVDI